MPTGRRALAEALESRCLRAATLPEVFGGGGFDNVERVIELRDGSKVVTGLFSGSVDFDQTGGTAVLTARGDTDIYVASYATDGSLNWVTQIGGDYHAKEMSQYGKRDIQLNQARFARYVGRVSGQPRLAGEYVNDIARDDAGNVYLVGSFRSTITAGSETLTANADYTSSYYDGLVLKISTTGQVSWAQQIGGGFDDDAMSVGVDRYGAAYVGGYFSREADIGGELPKNPLLKTDGRDGGYVIRLTTDGDLAWAYSFDSNSVGQDERNAVNDIAVTRSGEVYFAGSFAADADFASGPNAEYVLKANDKTDSVVGKLNRKGRMVWAESTGSDDYDANTNIALDASGHVYTLGYFSEEMDVNPLADVTTIFTPEVEDGDNHPEFSDLLVSKFTSDGTPVWQAQLGSAYIETAADLTVAADGAVYVTGSYFYEMDLAPGKTKYVVESVRTNDGSIKDKNTRFGRNESYDWFVSKLSPNGKFVTGKSLGHADDDYAGGLTVFADGSLAVYGRIVDSDIPDRDDRQEQAWIYEMSPNLKML
ncbi:MAG: hypothetical protein QM754_07420 [Tepidisphaeraceae bacterium]